MFDWFKRKNIEIVSEIKVHQPDIDFKKITEFIYMEFGITDLDKRALSFSRLKKYSLDKNIKSTNDFLKLFNKKDEFYRDILSIITVNETYFFREKKELDYLIDYIKNSSNKLKILSLPCSTGEEVYSILILMLEKEISLDKVEIVGLDVDFEVIKKAKKGIYKQHSLHKIDENLKQKYFTKIDETQFEIKSYLKLHVSFKQQNIFELNVDNEKFDVVLSRNMMIYFDDKKRDIAFQTIFSILKDNGIFVKGHADNLRKTELFKNLVFGIYKKIKL